MSRGQVRRNDADRSPIGWLVGETEGRGTKLRESRKKVRGGTVLLRCSRHPQLRMLAVILLRKKVLQLRIDVLEGVADKTQFYV